MNFLGSNSLLGIHLSQQLKNFKIFYHLQSLREAFMESICPKIGGLTVICKDSPTIVALSFMKKLKIILPPNLTSGLLFTIHY